MSTYGLIKATSRIQRSDTIADLHIVNKWRLSKGLNTVSSSGPSIRLLENCVAQGIENLDISDLPKLERGASFYLSISCEIKDKERKTFKIHNKI